MATPIYKRHSKAPSPMASACPILRCSPNHPGANSRPPTSSAFWPSATVLEGLDKSAWSFDEKGSGVLTSETGGPLASAPPKPPSSPSAEVPSPIAQAPNISISPGFNARIPSFGNSSIEQASSSTSKKKFPSCWA